VPPFHPWTIDPDERGLEIGPLDKPRLSKDQHRVEYLDHLHTEALREKYAGDANVGEIHTVDHVWSGGGSLAAVIGASAPFDYVVASHVIEHVPNPVRWLHELSTVLRPGGRIHLIVPDKRFCFDVNRDETHVGDLVAAYLDNAELPSARQIYDFQSRFVVVDTVGLWDGTVSYEGVVRDDIEDLDRWCLELCEEFAGKGQYLDVHCWAFTPASFAESYLRLVELGLVDLVVEELIPTPRNTLEFYVTLRTGAPGDPASLPEDAAKAARVAARAGAVPGTTAAERVRPSDGGADPLAVMARRLDEVERLLRTQLEGISLAAARFNRVANAVRHPARTAEKLVGRMKRSGP
jgi:SAM-dependent methyltransferase